MIVLSDIKKQQLTFFVVNAPAVGSSSTVILSGLTSCSWPEVRCPFTMTAALMPFLSVVYTVWTTDVAGTSGTIFPVPPRVLLKHPIVLGHLRQTSAEPPSHASCFETPHTPIDVLHIVNVSKREPGDVLRLGQLRLNTPFKNNEQQKKWRNKHGVHFAIYRSSRNSKQGSKEFRAFTMTRECGRCITMIACMMHFALLHCHSQQPQAKRVSSF